MTPNFFIPDGIKYMHPMVNKLGHLCKYLILTFRIYKKDPQKYIYIYYWEGSSESINNTIILCIGSSRASPNLGSSRASPNLSFLDNSSLLVGSSHIPVTFTSIRRNLLHHSSYYIRPQELPIGITHYSCKRAIRYADQRIAMHTQEQLLTTL